MPLVSTGPSALGAGGWQPSVKSGDSVPPDEDPSTIVPHAYSTPAAYPCEVAPSSACVWALKKYRPSGSPSSFFSALATGVNTQKFLW